MEEGCITSETWLKYVLEPAAEELELERVGISDGEGGADVGVTPDVTVTVCVAAGIDKPEAKEAKGKLVQKLAHALYTDKGLCVSHRDLAK